MRKHINLTLLGICAVVSHARDVTTENFLKEVSDADVKAHPMLKEYPRQFDWRQRSFVVPPVKTQPEGYKGSRAYAMTSALES
jgi:hypothetical protein